MSAAPVGIVSTGLVCAVGLCAPAACAAIRAGIANPTESKFMDSNGEWIMAHQVPLESPLRGGAKLLEMAVSAIEECMTLVPREQWAQTPLLLCVAESERPGRLDGLNEELFLQLQRHLSVEFASGSGTVACGRVGPGLALRRAREMLAKGSAAQVLIAATDSLLTQETLRSYERAGRLLTLTNANGFSPGEGAAAVLVSASSRGLWCAGLGFAIEPATIDSEEPLRAQGLSQAIKQALGEAECRMHELDFRITDIAGEQYYFKEAALAVSRLLRVRKPEFDLWNPAECVGECGSVSGLVSLIVAEAACRKKYAAGPSILWHLAADSGQRVAAVLRSGSATGETSRG